MNTELETVTHAVEKFDAVAAGLESLRSKFSGVVFDVATTKGMTDAKAARAEIREPRYEIERVRKAAKAPILALGKALDSKAEQITREILAIEEPLDQQIKAEEQRKEDERQAKIAAEQKRVQDIQDRIQAIRDTPTKASGSNAVTIADYFELLGKLEIDASFEEFQTQAKDAKDAALLALHKFYDDRVAYEDEQRRILAERAELGRLREEQEARNRAEQARLAQEEQVARKAREAEEARLRAAREAQQAETRRLQKIEDDRLAAERRRQADQQAELDRQARELEEQRAAAARAAKPRIRAGAAFERPTDEQLALVIAEHWKVPLATAIAWLKDFRKAA